MVVRILGERGVLRERRVWCGQGDRVWGVVRDDGQVTWTEGGQARREQEAGEGEAEAEAEAGGRGVRAERVR